MRTVPLVLLVAFLGAAAAGCGSGSAESTTATQAAGPHEAITAPEPKELAAGDSLEVSRDELQTTGYQAACIVNGQRGTVQALPGQAVSSHVLRFGGDGPMVVVTRRADGSILVNCRKSGG